MSSSSVTPKAKAFNIKVSFNQKIEGLSLTLIDGNLNPILEGRDLQTIDLHLEQGLYQLKVYYIDYYQEYIVQADSDKEMMLDFNYPCVAPVLSFKTTTTRLSEIAETAALKATAGGENPTFLFFAAKYDSTLFTDITAENLLQEYRILDANGTQIFRFNPKNTLIDKESGCIAFSAKLNGGLYFLKWQAEDKRIMPFYIWDNYQTQFFIRYGNKADFENSLFFYNDKSGFNRENEAYVTLDKVLYAYKDYRNYELLSQKDIDIIKQNPYLVSLVKILQMFLKKESEFEKIYYLELPDFEFITHDKKKSIKKRDDLLPIMSFVMSRLGVFKKKDGLQFKPGSLVDRTTDHAKYDIFWNSFTKIDEASEWKNIYTGLIHKFNKFIIDELEVSNHEEIEEDDLVFRQQSSFEQHEAVEESEKAIPPKPKAESSFFNIKDISKMASKLNVPPTKILRNFTAYKDIFDRLK